MTHSVITLKMTMRYPPTGTKRRYKHSRESLKPRMLVM